MMRESQLNICSVAPADASGVARRPIKLALVSSGLGSTNRGFEISTARWFSALRQYSDLDVRLFCGGDFAGGKKLWNFPRNSFWTLPFQLLPFCDEQRRWELCYGTEQISFWTALTLELMSCNPDVVWVKDVPLAHLLLASRAVFGFNYKVILANGGMLRPKTYKDFDVIQQISNSAYDEALEFGIPAEKMQLISNCFPPLNSAASRAVTRKSIGVDENDWVIICVAAWNKYHKRIDYLLEEVARLEDPHVKLVLCGAPELDCEELQELGKKLLGNRVRWLTVEPHVVPELLHAADLFVLPSLRESLGNALVEAILCGVPVVTHPHDGARFALQDPFWMTDLSAPGNLYQRLLSFKNNPPGKERIQALKADVTERFGERHLAKQFETMVVDACRR